MKSDLAEMNLPIEGYTTGGEKPNPFIGELRQFPNYVIVIGMKIKAYIAFSNFKGATTGRLFSRAQKIGA